MPKFSTKCRCDYWRFPPNQLPISVVDRLLDENGHFTDQDTLKAIHHQLDDFIIWSEGHKRMVG